MGFARTVPIFLILMVFNGFFQGMGAPPCSIVLGKWFSQKERGLKMGIWNTSHNIRWRFNRPYCILFIIFGQNHFQSIFFVPAIICTIVALFCYVIGADTPASVGLPPVEEYRNDYPEVKAEVNPTTLSSKEIIVICS